MTVSLKRCNGMRISEMLHRCCVHRAQALRGEMYSSEGRECREGLVLEGAVPSCVTAKSGARCDEGTVGAREGGV